MALPSDTLPQPSKIHGAMGFGTYHASQWTRVHDSHNLTQGRECALPAQSNGYKVQAQVQGKLYISYTDAKDETDRSTSIIPYLVETLPPISIII